MNGSFFARRFVKAAALPLLAVVMLRAWPHEPLMRRFPLSTGMWSADGELLRVTRAADDQYRLWVPLPQISSELIEAFLLKEDRWFHWNPGINPVSLARAAIRTYRGGERQGVVTRQDVCAMGRGAGAIRTPEGRCAPCHGTGNVRWARGHMVFTKACAACHGSGRQRSQRCPACTGSGRQVRTEGVSVAIPPGIVEGARLRVADMGHAGRHGGRNGDLYVTVQVQPHPIFRRQGDDLCMVLPIGVHQAVLGSRVEVPSLEGPVSLRIPPGTQAGQRFRLRERGVPTPSGRGDLLVETRIVLPQIVDERGKELMREFGKLYGH